MPKANSGFTGTMTLKWSPFITPAVIRCSYACSLDENCFPEFSKIPVSVKLDNTLSKNVPTIHNTY